jgi:hypothetical protein
MYIKTNKNNPLFSFYVQYLIQTSTWLKCSPSLSSCTIHRHSAYYPKEASMSIFSFNSSQSWDATGAGIKAHVLKSSIHFWPELKPCHPAPKC